MQTTTIHEGTVSFRAATGIDRFTLNRACDAAITQASAAHYQAMRNPLTAAMKGVRQWPEVLTAETVASWILANVSYSTPWEAHQILEAYAFESNR